MNTGCLNLTYNSLNNKCYSYSVEHAEHSGICYCISSNKPRASNKCHTMDQNIRILDQNKCLSLLSVTTQNAALTRNLT